MKRFHIYNSDYDSPGKKKTAMMETDVKPSISREWQEDSMRYFDILHSSPFLDPMVVREFYLTIPEWCIDCL